MLFRSVPTYKYVFFTNDDKEETGKSYLIVDLEYKNLETKSIILKDRISSKAIYQDKYEYDLDIYDNAVDSVIFHCIILPALRLNSKFIFSVTDLDFSRI